VDDSNSRGAIDMGMVPELLPGYQPSNQSGMTTADMIVDSNLGALWVVGANPLRTGSTKAFLVVQDLFLTETAQQADVVLPSASAYEKTGTVTNVTGEIQRLAQALRVMGPKPDLEIIGLIGREMGVAAQMGPWIPEKVLTEIRSTVRAYNVPLPLIDTGGAAQTMPVNGRIPVEINPELIQSQHENLFTSGTLGRYSGILNSVLEHQRQ
jgi:NADH-quinone oxidoreductase subunit G